MDKWLYGVLVGLGILFFVMAVWAEPFGCVTHPLLRASSPRGDLTTCVLDSPDETANFFWVSRVGEGRELWYDEPLNGVGNNLLRPRSFNVADGKVAPGSFLGEILLYGYMAKWFGVGVIPYLTPLFASLAVVVFGLLIWRLLGREIGVISAAVLAVLPPWWYYSARGMYHNVLLVSLVIIGIYLLIVLVDRGYRGIRWLNILGWGVTGLMIGFAVVVRSSEIVWVAFLIMVIWLYGYMIIWRERRWREFPLPGLLLFIACGLFAFVPLFKTNIEIYGAPLSLSYAGLQGMEIQEFIARLSQPQFRNLFFAPFGFNIRQARETVYAFLLNYYPWWFWGVAGGAALAIVRGIGVISKGGRRWIWYLLVYLFISLLLVVYYGSWEFSDRIDRETVSLNTSFFRYWLPIYVGGVPFIGLLIYWFIDLITRKSPLGPLLNKEGMWWFQILTAIVAIIAFAYLSAKQVLYASDESLIPVRNRQSLMRAERNAILQAIPRNAVVVTFPQADKVLFPEFERIITRLNNAADYHALSQLVKLAPVYFYTFAPLERVQKIIAPRFNAYGLRLVNGREVFEERWIWKMTESEN